MEGESSLPLAAGVGVGVGVPGPKLAVRVLPTTSGWAPCPLFSLPPGTSPMSCLPHYPNSYSYSYSPSIVLGEQLMLLKACSSSKTI